nr:hypothetical protein [FCB group bacterium]
NVKQDFSPQEVANRLRTSVPINNPNFTVYINGVELQPMFHEGRRFPVDIDTKYGKIIGQLILKDKGVSHRDEGIDCCVKGVMIKKSLFGFEGYKKGENRIVGKINADFLPFTASRDDFIKDSDEYLLFSDLMRKKVSFVFNLIQDAHRDKEMDQSGEALIKAAKMFNNAFKNAPHLFPKTYSHVTDSHTNSEDLDEISSSSIITNKSSRKRLIRKKPIIQRGEYKKVHINPLFEHKVIKRLKTDFGFTFAFTEEGSEGLPSYYVNDTIYVNREHRLYKYYNNDIESEVAHLVRILTAEAILLLDPLDMRQSYEKQIELLSAIYVKAKQYLNQ